MLVSLTGHPIWVSYCFVCSGSFILRAFGKLWASKHKNLAYTSIRYIIVYKYVGMIPLVYRRPQEPTLNGTSLFIWRLKGKCRASCRTEESWAGGRIRPLHAFIWPTRGQIWPAPHSQHKIMCLYGAIQLFNLPGEHLHNVMCLPSLISRDCWGDC